MLRLSISNTCRRSFDGHPRVYFDVREDSRATVGEPKVEFFSILAERDVGAEWVMMADSPSGTVVMATVTLLATGCVEADGTWDQCEDETAFVSVTATVGAALQRADDP